MKLRFYDMIDLYMENERLRFYREVEKKKRNILEEFAFYLDDVKKKVWDIREITEEDGRSYYQRLLKDKGGFDQVERYIQVINGFMGFAVKQGWIKIRPWKSLYEHKRGGDGHLRVNEDERRSLMNYLWEFKPYDFFTRRDRAMLMLYLAYKLKRTEISSLNTIDYTGKAIKITSAMKWREREIELKEHEIKAIDEYLRDRIKQGKALNEKALFIGRRYHRIAPSMLNRILKIYLMRIRED